MYLYTCRYKTVRKRAIPYSDPDGYMKVKAQGKRGKQTESSRLVRGAWELCEYLPELCTEHLRDILRTVGCSGLASVNLLK